MSDESHGDGRVRCDDPLPKAPSLVECDEGWRSLIDAVHSAGIAVVRLPPEQGEAMAEAGVSEQLLARLRYGYPAERRSLGRLEFFPPLTHFPRRMPELFFLADAWEGERKLKRRLRTQLAVVVEAGDGALEWTLLRAAAAYFRAFGARDAFAQDGPLRYWRNGAEARLRGELGDSESSLQETLALFGPVLSTERYEGELERRLMVGRLWCLVALAAAGVALSQSWGLSSRLLIAFAALAALGGGLGFGPWSRANAQRKALLSREASFET